MKDCFYQILNAEFLSSIFLVSKNNFFRSLDVYIDFVLNLLLHYEVKCLSLKINSMKINLHLT